MAKDSKATSKMTAGSSGALTAGSGGALGRIQKVEGYGTAPMPKSGVPIGMPKGTK